MDMEHWIHEYLITLYVRKTLEHDRKQIGGFKLVRAVEELFGKLCQRADAEHAEAKRQLRSKGCRIVSEGVMADKCVRAVYEYRNCEFNCVIRAEALRSKCELRLKELMGRISC